LNERMDNFAVNAAHAAKISPRKWLSRIHVENGAWAG
jgi:hypothetical protein